MAYSYVDNAQSLVITFCILGPLHIGFTTPFCTLIPTLHEVKIELYESLPTVDCKQLVLLRTMTFGI